MSPMPIKLFVGWDPSEAVGFHAFTQSLLEKSSVPVNITPLSATVLETRAGSNQFTWARFAVPRLCGYSGGAIFMDGSDMLMRCDIAELEALRDPFMAVQVVKHRYSTKHGKKYIGTPMECPNIDYDRKNWASVMLINCWHKSWRHAGDALDSLQLKFIDDDLIGELNPNWNWLVDEYGPNPDAKVLHWTAGIPAFPHYRNAPHADEWFAACDHALMTDWAATKREAPHDFDMALANA